MKILYYLSYNNYYNRLLKRKETVNDYINGGEAIVCGPAATVNFFPNDGIATTQTAYLNQLEQIPDYLLVVNDISGAIESRWFVVECQYNTGKTQYILSLYRDVIADWWNDIANAPFFCEKGWASILDSAIYNEEAITTNQIKKEEYPLKDGSQIPWIVGYYSVQQASEADSTPISFNTTRITEDFEVPDITQWEFRGFNRNFVDDWNLSYFAYFNPLIGFSKMRHCPFRPGVKGTPEDGSDSEGVYENWETAVATAPMIIDEAASSSGYYADQTRTAFQDYTGFYLDTTKMQEALALNGKIVKDTATGKLYQINVVRQQYNRTYAKIDINSSLGQLMTNELAVAINAYMAGSPQTHNLEYSCSYSSVSVQLLAVTLDEGTIDIKKTRRKLFDAPYCMFCMPYGDFPIKINAQITGGTTALDSLNIATAIAEQTGDYCYDIQLLPYCPIPKLRYTDPSKLPFLGNQMVVGQDYSIAYNQDNAIIGVLFWCENSTGTIIMDSPKSFTLPEKALDFKVGNQTEKWRLCSPNYNGVFEFSPYKNRGVVSFQADYTYKPYQPYIRVAPNFGGLYGSEFGDARGLIVGGDFSLPIINNQWKTYEINNKNYQIMFDRQIQNLDVQHKYQRMEQIANAIIGTVSGGATGAMAGSTVGPMGAAIGGAIGGIASLGGGITDYNIGEALRTEARDYTKDLYGYQLDNIKALPNSLTRVSAFNINNKIFPFIEIYDCTTEEKEAVRNKITYDGMSIGRIGTITQFSGGDLEWTYVKGQLIRLIDIIEDSHVINTIANELNKGVFIRQ